VFVDEEIGDGVVFTVELGAEKYQIACQQEQACGCFPVVICCPELLQIQH
jgi:hypothetical protein